MFAAPPVIRATEIFRLPEAHRRRGRHAALLEGPAFDRAGTLFFVNIWLGQIWSLAPSGESKLVVEYDGQPNGLAIHADGRIFIADHQRGLLSLDVLSGQMKTLLAAPPEGAFHGLNDLVFTSAGDLFFTDQGNSSLGDPCGRLWRLKADGKLEQILGGIPSPNGIVPSLDERIVYLAVTRANAIWRVPVRHDATPGRVGTYIQMSGGTGPDGLALDVQGGLAVAHAGMGSAWLFGESGRPVLEIQAGDDPLVTNLAYGGAGGSRLFITSASGIYTADVDVPGRPLFSHSADKGPSNIYT